jgi:hypothetical protein
MRARVRAQKPFCGSLSRLLQLPASSLSKRRVRECRCRPSSSNSAARHGRRARFDAAGTTKLQNDLATLQLRPNSVFKRDAWQARVRCGCTAFNATVVAARVVLSRTAVGFVHHDEQATACCSLSRCAAGKFCCAVKEFLCGSHDGHSDCYHETTLRHECVCAGAI